MGMFDKFPYRNTRDLNLNWIIKKILELEGLVGAAVSDVAQFLSKKGGKMEGSIDMNNNRITNVPTPAADADAVNKNYVDGKTGNYLPLSGGTMTGPVNMGNQKISNVKTPTADRDVATKKYVDDRDSNYLPLSGGTMTGAVDMGNQKITNVSNPTDNQDVATKKYVDDHSGSVTGDYLPLSGGNMTGPVDMGNQKITNVPDPTAEQDVATKKYVDARGGSVNEITYGQVSLFGKRMSKTRSLFYIFLPFSVSTESVTFENLNAYNLRFLTNAGQQTAYLPITRTSRKVQGSPSNIIEIDVYTESNDSYNNYMDAIVEITAGFTVRKS